MRSQGFDYSAVPDLLRRFLPGSRPALIIATALALVSAAAQLVLPWALYRAVMVHVEGASTLSTTQLAFVAVAGLVIAYLTLGGSIALAHIVAFDVIARIRCALGQAWADADLEQLQRSHSSSARAAASEKAESLEGVIAHGIPETVSNLALWAGMTCWLFFTDWRLALAALIVIPVAFGTMRRAMSTNAHRMGEWMTADAEMIRAIGDQLAASKELRVFGARWSGPPVREAVRRGARLQRAWGLGFLRWGAWFSPLASATAAAVVVVGGWLLAFDRLSLGPFVLFLILAPAYTAPLVEVFYRMHTLPMAAANVDAIAEQLAVGKPSDAGADAAGGAETERGAGTRQAHGAVPGGGASRSETTGDVRFIQVNYSYGITESGGTGASAAPPAESSVLEAPGGSGAPKESSALRGVDLEIPGGSHVAVIGPSGAGKSTLAELACGLRSPSSGRVLVDGVSPRELVEIKIEDGAERPAFALATQEPMLFAGTVAENLRLGQPSASDAELAETLAAVALYDELGEAGVNTVLGEAGSGLSGGQRQRLAIARALLAGAPVTILDEPTSALDTETEKKVLRGIRDQCAGRTLLLITHRLDIARELDDIVVVADGAVVAQGGTQEVENAPVARELFAADRRAKAALR